MLEIGCRSSVEYTHKYGVEKYQSFYEVRVRCTEFLRPDTTAAIFFSLFVLVQLLFKGSYYSREVFIFFGATDCAATVRGQRLLEGSDYSRVECN